MYGGTFDPIHNGHLHLIHQLLVKKIVDRILVIPAGQPRLRQGVPSAPANDRLAMCARAVEELPSDLRSRVEVLDLEVVRPGTTYSIDTVEEIAKSHPDDELCFIVGSDAYANINQWHRSDELKKMVEFVVIDRPDFPGEHTHEIGALKVSATAVRSGESVDIPRSVADYIKEHGLYASK